MVQRQATQCVHRWLLSEPNYGAVRGICRRCGARRTYPSGLETPETLPDYEELTADRPALAAATPSSEKHETAWEAALDGAAVSLS
jgi:hypothetical protein